MSIIDFYVYRSYEMVKITVWVFSKEQYYPLYRTSNNPLYRDGMSYTSADNNYLILMKNLVIYMEDMVVHCIETQHHPFNQIMNIITYNYFCIQK